jgi:hypothetical protein
VHAAQEEVTPISCAKIVIITLSNFARGRQITSANEAKQERSGEHDDSNWTPSSH